jgi:hypothetical protein
MCATMKHPKLLGNLASELLGLLLGSAFVLR